MTGPWRALHLLVGTGLMCAPTIAQGTQAGTIGMTCSGTRTYSHGSQPPVKTSFLETYSVDLKNHRLCVKESCSNVVIFNNRMVIFACSDRMNTKTCRPGQNAGLFGQFPHKDQFTLDLKEGIFHRETSGTAGDFVAVPFEATIAAKCIILPLSGLSGTGVKPHHG